MTQEVFTCSFQETSLQIPDTSTQGITDTLWADYVQRQVGSIGSRTTVALGWRADGLVKVYTTDAPGLDPGDAYQMVTQFAPDNPDFYVFFGLALYAGATPYQGAPGAGQPDVVDGKMFAFILLVEDEGRKISPYGAPVHVVTPGRIELGPLAPLPASAFAQMVFEQVDPAEATPRTLH